MHLRPGGQARRGRQDLQVPLLRPQLGRHQALDPAEEQRPLRQAARQQPQPGVRGDGVRHRRPDHAGPDGGQGDSHEPGVGHADGELPREAEEVQPVLHGEVREGQRRVENRRLRLSVL